MPRPIIIFDDFTEEPLLSVISEPKLKGKINSVSLSSLFKRERPPISSDSYKVLDRVVSISSRTVGLIRANSPTISKGQISLAYEKFLSDSGVTPAKGRCYSTVGKLLPLTSQWSLVKTNLINLMVPKYVHSYGSEPVGNHGFSNPIYKSPFDLYSWKTNTKQPEKETIDEFIVDRPIGSPLLSYFLGKIVTVKHLNAELRISSSTEATIRSLTADIAEIFDAKAGEVLWFCDDSNLTFAAFSHHLSAASLQEEFRTNASQFLHDYFDQN